MSSLLNFFVVFVTIVESHFLVVRGATLPIMVVEDEVSPVNISNLESPRITDWGEWGEFDSCPENTFVRGMRLKTEPAQGPGDDTALNGISFMCGVLGEPQKILHSLSRQIHSSTGKWGTWGASYECPESYAVGFQLRSEERQNGQDDTAANNLRIFCSNSDPNNANYLEGSGLSWGEWTDTRFCEYGSAICAIRTQVEAAKGHGKLGVYLLIKYVH